MARNNLVEALARIEYKPAADLTVDYEYLPTYRFWRLTTTMRVLDVDDKNEKYDPLKETLSYSWPRMKVGRVDTMPDDLFARMSVEEWFQWLHGKVQDLELHEVDEWFQIDGQKFKDPHP